MELGKLLCGDGHADEGERVAALLAADLVHDLAHRLDLRLAVLDRLPERVDRAVVGLGRDEDAALERCQLGEDVVLEARLEELEPLGGDAAARGGEVGVNYTLPSRRARAPAARLIAVAELEGRASGRAHLYDLTLRSETACWRRTYGVPLREENAGSSQYERRARPSCERKR